MTHTTLHHGPGYRHSCRATILAFAGLLLCGGSATLAQDRSATDASEQRLELARSDASLAALQADASRQMFRESQVRYDAGVVSFNGFLRAHEAVADADARLKSAQLDVAEIAAGGGPIRTEISAPLVNGRDFVTERLQIEFESVALRSTNIEAFIKSAEAEVSAGVASSDSVRPLTVDRARLAAEAERIRETMALRRQFLDGAIDATAAELGLRLRQAIARRQVAEAEVAGLRVANDQMQAKFDAGTARSDEVSVVVTELRRAESDVRTAGTEIEMIERELTR